MKEQLKSSQDEKEAMRLEMELLREELLKSRREEAKQKEQLKQSEEEKGAMRQEMAVMEIQISDFEELEKDGRQAAAKETEKTTQLMEEAARELQRIKKRMEERRARASMVFGYSHKVLVCKLM